MATHTSSMFWATLHEGLCPSDDGSSSLPEQRMITDIQQYVTGRSTPASSLSSPGMKRSRAKVGKPVYVACICLSTTSSLYPLHVPPHSCWHYLLNHRVIIVDEIDALLPESTAADLASSRSAAATGGRRASSAKRGSRPSRAAQSSLEALYTLFSMAAAPGSRLVLVTIANAINAAERFAPRLVSMRAEPTQIVFKPYNEAQLAQIVQCRLALAAGSEEAPPIFDDAALRIIARRVSARSGDARAMLEAAAQAIQHAEAASAPADKSSDCPKVTLAHAATARAPAAVSAQRTALQTLPATGQVLVVAALGLLSRDDSNASGIRVGGLSETYLRLMRTKLRDSTVTSAEATDAISRCIDCGVLVVVGQATAPGSRGRKARAGAASVGAGYSPNTLVRLGVTYADVEELCSDTAAWKALQAERHGRGMQHTFA